MYIIHQISELEMIRDNLRLWRFKARNFDDKSEGGQNLNQVSAKHATRRNWDTPTAHRTHLPPVCLFTGAHGRALD